MRIKGSKIRLLDNSLIRRFGGMIVIVDPHVSKVLIEKGLAKLIEEETEGKEEEEFKTDNIYFEDRIFPIEIINESII